MTCPASFVRMACLALYPGKPTLLTDPIRTLWRLRLESARSHLNHALRAARGTPFSGRILRMRRWVDTELGRLGK